MPHGGFIIATGVTITELSFTCLNITGIIDADRD